jgi:hypothetical protein
MPKKRCLFCREWFEPYIPRAAIQKLCGASKCRRKLKRMLDRAWRRRDPQWRKDLQTQMRGWRRGYMRGYRENHAAYRAREAARMKRRRLRPS